MRFWRWFNPRLLSHGNDGDFANTGRASPDMARRADRLSARKSNLIRRISRANPDWGSPRIDFFTIPTIRFRIVFVLVVLLGVHRHYERRAARS